MEIKLLKHELMLLELLRAALNQDKAKVELFEACTSEIWCTCYKLAVQQGVMALAWDGVSTLPEDRMPPRSLKLKWALGVESYEKRYRHYSHVIKQLTDFYALHGIATMQLKGVGFSSYYPVPEHREGGDIDIYTFSADKSVMSDKEANALADKLMEEQGIEVDYHDKKHSCFYYQGIPIENHKTFLDVNLFEAAKSIEKLLDQNCVPVTVSLVQQQTINVPTNQFNTLFISFHALVHAGKGLNLHHLCDWACLLKRNGLLLPEGLTEKGFLRFIAMLTAFTNGFLGTKVLVEYTEGDLNELVYEIFRSSCQKECMSKNLLTIFCFKIWCFVHVSYIQKKYMSHSILKRINRSLVSHIRNPKTIFLYKKI